LLYSVRIQLGEQAIDALGGDLIALERGASRLLDQLADRVHARLARFLDRGFQALELARGERVELALERCEQALAELVGARLGAGAAGNAREQRVAGLLAAGGIEPGTP
jgi:hypothetical protein